MDMDIYTEIVYKEKRNHDLGSYRRTTVTDEFHRFISGPDPKKGSTDRLASEDYKLC